MPVTIGEPPVKCPPVENAPPRPPFVITPAGPTSSSLHVRRFLLCVRPYHITRPHQAIACACGGGRTSPPWPPLRRVRVELSAEVGVQHVVGRRDEVPGCDVGRRQRVRERQVHRRRRRRARRNARAVHLHLVVLGQGRVEVEPRAEERARHRLSRSHHDPVARRRPDDVASESVWTYTKQYAQQYALVAKFPCTMSVAYTMSSPASREPVGRVRDRLELVHTLRAEPEEAALGLRELRLGLVVVNRLRA